MTPTVKKFSADLLAEFKSALEKQNTAETISKIKAGSTGTFSFVISTSDEDRQGDSLDQSKWKLDNYKANPVVLWAHDYYQPPIGVCTSISVKDGQLVAEGKFASAELSPFAAQIQGLYEAGFIKATSVGYIQHEDGELELLEFSLVPVPANPYALSMRQAKKLHLDIPQLVMKGLTFTAKAEQVGDHCELDDGTPGILAEDPNNPGELVCVPPEEGKSAKDAKADTRKDLAQALTAENARHGAAVAKSIEEYKSLDEFKSAVGTENDAHLEKCMKAIDENYELQDQKKSLDEFKAAMQSEHGDHVKCFTKAIEEFKGIEEFQKTASDELDRHAKAQMELCKAEMGEGETDEEKAYKNLTEKIGRRISAANKEKINAIIKAIEDHHAEHGAETQKQIAALKELVSQGDEGEEPKPEKDLAPNSRSSSAGAATNKELSISEYDAYLFAQRLMRQVKTASEDGLRQIKETLKAKAPSRR